MLSWMRTEKEGDSLSPKLRQVLSNLKVSGWATLYLDPRNELKAKVLEIVILRLFPETPHRGFLRVHECQFVGPVAIRTDEDLR